MRDDWVLLGIYKMMSVGSIKDSISMDGVIQD